MYRFLFYKRNKICSFNYKFIKGIKSVVSITNSNRQSLSYVQRNIRSVNLKPLNILNLDPMDILNLCKNSWNGKPAELVNWRDGLPDETVWMLFSKPKRLIALLPFHYRRALLPPLNCRRAGKPKKRRRGEEWEGDAITRVESGRIVDSRPRDLHYFPLSQFIIRYWTMPFLSYLSKFALYLPRPHGSHC